MALAEAVIAGLFGLLTGSFLNVCIYRLPRDLSVVHPRSHCPGCENMIAWYDNIPLLSWIVLKGRCRHCGAGISLRYPAVELVTGLLFAAGFLVFGPGLPAVKFCLFAAIQTALVITDLEQRILPDELTKGGIAAGIVLAAFVPPPPGLAALLLPDTVNSRLAGVIESASSAALLAFVLWGIGALYLRLRGREGLGFGDVKMVACIAAFLGLSPSLLALAAGSLLGSVAGIAWILIAKKDASTFELPFGSFLGLGAIAVALVRPGDFIL
ncbi:MAG: prepilin peptidase [Bryobacteraceae bacterium]|nr:prepilin peptidase [Bryobacteraceae bacterium]